MSNFKEDIDLAKDVLDLCARSGVKGVGTKLLEKLVDYCENNLDELLKSQGE